MRGLEGDIVGERALRRFNIKVVEATEGDVRVQSRGVALVSQAVYG